MKIALYGQASGPGIAEPVEDLLDELQKYGADIAVEKEFSKGLNLVAGTPKFTLTTGLDPSFDLMVSFGGDGTILRAITYIRDLGIPVVGVNTGRLGLSLIHI